jgi:hypothetical protein
MRSNANKTYYFHAEANPLGGFIEKPFERHIPSQASVSLPAVGGHATARIESFNFEEIVSCRSAYTRVTGKQVEEGGSWFTVVTSVVEGLNILEVVTAERIVAQVAVEHPFDGGTPRISFAGSRFEQLKIGGTDVSPVLNAGLLAHGAGPGSSRNPVGWHLFQETGSQQAAKLIKSVSADDDRDAHKWIVERYGWLASKRKPGEHGCVLCSLVDGVDRAIPGKSFGHVAHIPHFGRIIFGEVLAFPESIQLSMIRAELGCATKGGLNVACVAENGSTFPPR